MFGVGVIQQSPLPPLYDSPFTVNWWTRIPTLARHCLAKQSLPKSAMSTFRGTHIQKFKSYVAGSAKEPMKKGCRSGHPAMHRVKNSWYSREYGYTSKMMLSNWILAVMRAFGGACVYSTPSLSLGCGKESLVRQTIHGLPRIDSQLKR